MPSEPRDTIAEGLTYDGDPHDAPSVNLVVAHRDGLSTVPLYEGHDLVVGREPPAHIRPRSRRLSRRHARFLLDDGVVYVEDLGSTNGTFVGGRKVQGRVSLAPGVEVRVGSVSISVGRDRPDAPPVAPRAPDAMVVAAPAMVRLYDTVDRVAASQLSVLIYGETGTGKEVVARAIHDRSPRAKGPMRSINCGALPGTLIESTLFGHERGAFTGADQRRAGVFEEATGGTVLLDEVGELSAPAQAALLRVLETRKVQRVGSTQEIPVDVRVLAATHRDLQGMCDAGTFRVDLLYRLNSVTLDVPPLRERRQEIGPLIEAFVEHANAANGRSVQGPTPAAMERLRLYPWPGNVRELRNAVERAVVVCSGQWFDVLDLPSSVREGEESSQDATPSIAFRHTEIDSVEAWQRGMQVLDMKARVSAFEEGLIRSAMAEAGDNQTRAAELLGMPRRTLVYRLRSMDLEGPTEPLEDGVSIRDRVDAFERHIVEEAMARAGDDVSAAARLLSVQKRTLVSRLRRWDSD